MIEAFHSNACQRGLAFTTWITPLVVPERYQHQEAEITMAKSLNILQLILVALTSPVGARLLQQGEESRKQQPGARPSTAGAPVSSFVLTMYFSCVSSP
jgi:hypothetical protein